jgi:toxin-antitoxin system PIN domain toxin
MILVDANLLLYAYNSASPQHRPARQWLENAFSQKQPVGFCWLTLLAFFRISTNFRIFPAPFSAKESLAIIATWLEQPSACILEPGEQFWKIWTALIKEGQATGPLASDAFLAALAIEHGAALFSTDRDFSRFLKLKFVNPLSSK